LLERCPKFEESFHRGRVADSRWSGSKVLLDRNFQIF
jgi:hypothetical protein